MTYQQERDEFIALATKEGLDLGTIRKLLRYATTLQRLAEAQCNGDWPYNGGRDRPALSELSGDLVQLKWDKRYTVCPKCEASGVAKSAMRWTIEPNGSTSRMLVCPDCRTQELVKALLTADDCLITRNAKITPVFGGDPRGAVLRLSTPNYPYDESGHNGARGLYVPAREI